MFCLYDVVVVIKLQKFVCEVANDHFGSVAGHAGVELWGSVFNDGQTSSGFSGLVAQRLELRISAGQPILA